jgi:3-oxoacyl-[acyl-carrier-protein] synthase-1
MILGANMIKTQRADIVIAGGSECLSKFHLNGFHTLKILDEQPCKPFDEHRNGINLGEGAAYLVLETEETAHKRNLQPICYLSGYANTCDAYHQTASSPQGEGAFLSMEKALKSSGLQSNQIDYINAHGTGTPNNDLTEGIAIMRIFGNRIPFVSSTKAFTGHTTSAAGAVEAVISVLSLAYHFVPPNLNLHTAMADLSFKPTDKLVSCDLNHVLTNSFAFGGNDSSLIFSKTHPIS